MTTGRISLMRKTVKQRCCQLRMLSKWNNKAPPAWLNGK
jgi:hypothetical protein